MTVPEIYAWKCVLLINKLFLGNQKATNLEETVQNILTNLKILRKNMSFKLD